MLMKTIRGEQHDQETAEQIKEKRGLDPGILIKRYIEEMKHVHGDVRRLDLNLLALVARLYGPVVLEKTSRRLRIFRTRSGQPSG